MRHPRLTPLVAVAHGSRDPRAAATVARAAVRRPRPRAARRGLPGLDVRAAFLDHCAPSLPQVLGGPCARGAARDPTAGGRRRRLLLTGARITARPTSRPSWPPAAAARPGLDVVSRRDARPAPRCCSPPWSGGCARRRAAGDAGARAATGVVLAAAGSSDPAANATIAELAARWARERGWRAVVPAYASAAGPRPAESVRALRDGRGGAASSPRRTCSPLATSPTRSATRRSAPGRPPSPAVLGAAPEVPTSSLDRYLAADLAARRASKTAVHAAPPPMLRLRPRTRVSGPPWADAGWPIVCGLVSRRWITATTLPR